MASSSWILTRVRPPAANLTFRFLVTREPRDTCVHCITHICLFLIWTQTAFWTVVSFAGHSRIYINCGNTHTTSILALLVTLLYSCSMTMLMMMMMKQVDVWANRRQRLVVLYAHHYLVVHSEPRSLPHHRANVDADRVGWRSVQTDRNRLRHPQRWIHQGILSGTVWGVSDGSGSSPAIQWTVTFCSISFVNRRSIP